MTKQNANQIFETISKAIANKFEDRVIVEFNNGDTMLLDFANSDSTPFETDCVAWYVIQTPIYDNEGEIIDFDEKDYGSFTQYSEAFNFVRNTMEKHAGSIRVETF